MNICNKKTVRYFLNAPLFILINIEMAKISICCSHVMFNLPAAIAGDNLADDTEKILSIRRYPRRTNVSLHLLTIAKLSLSPNSTKLG